MSDPGSYPVAYEDCGHDNMALGVSAAGRYWFCPDCGWRRDAENRSGAAEQ